MQFKSRSCVRDRTQYVHARNLQQNRKWVNTWNHYYANKNALLFEDGEKNVCNIFFMIYAHKIHTNKNLHFRTMLFQLIKKIFLSSNSSHKIFELNICDCIYGRSNEKSIFSNAIVHILVEVTGSMFIIIIRYWRLF